MAKALKQMLKRGPVDETTGKQQLCLHLSPLLGDPQSRHGIQQLGVAQWLAGERGWQHRVGFGQILLKLGEAGRYGHLKESDIVSRLFNNISGEKPYSLLREAFFVDRQNYRSDVLARTLGYIGIENAASRVATSPAMTDFLENNRPGTTFESELNRFVKLRNEAAHSQVGEVVGIDELKLFADSLLVLCRVLADIVSQHVYAGRNALGQLSQLGVISHVYGHGRVVIARVSAHPIRVGEEVLVARAGKLRIAKIRSIQLDGISVDNVYPKEGQEVGLGLETDTRCREGTLLYRTTSALVNVPTTPTLFTAEELAALEPLQADESEDEALGEEPLPEEAEEPNSEAQSE